MISRIQNHFPRTDTRGDIVDCHDGCLECFAGGFYLYGTAYGDQDGFTKANRYVCYSSPDLVRWTPHGCLFSRQPDGVMYRPYVKFHPVQRRYVLWFNWYPTLWQGQYGVAVSDRPEGPFEIVEYKARVNGELPGDHSLFVDDDGTAYLIYTDIAAGHRIRVERLNADWTGSTGEQSDLFEPRHEATAMFRHDGRLYASFGNNCCFCPEGAGVRVYRADHPLGPFSFVRDINRDDAGKVIVPGQQTHVATLPTPSGPRLMWMCDLWGSRPDGIKGHDLQYWGPLEVDADGPRRLSWLGEWSVELAQAAASTAPGGQVAGAA